MYVIADSTDNSITLSESLCSDIGIHLLKENKVLTFLEPKYKEYAFTINPDIDQETQLSELQYNSKYKSVGFESLIPTVNRIFYDYGIPSSVSKCKLSVRKIITKHITYYRLCRPLNK